MCSAFRMLGLGTEPTLSFLTFNYFPLLHPLLLVLVFERIDNIAFTGGVVIEVVLDLLSEHVRRQIIVLQDLDKILYLDVLILFEGFLSKVHKLLLPFSLLLILL